MGRKAKLRAERRQADGPRRRNNTAALAAKQPPAASPSEFDQLEVPALVASGEMATSEEDSPNLLQRVLPFLKRNKTESSVQSGMDVDEFFDCYQPLLGAIAWHGYKTQGRGYVLGIPTSEETVALRYVSRKTLKQYTEPEERPMCRELMDSYDPKTEVTLILMTSTGETMLSSPCETDPLPPKAYQQWQESDGSLELFLEATNTVLVADEEE